MVQLKETILLCSLLTLKCESPCRLLGKQTGKNVTAAPPNYSVRIYDCFLFNDEVDMLEIRLNEMGPWVDYFVLLESSLTFTKLSKRKVYSEVKERFQLFDEKIIYLSVDSFPDNGDSWSNERFLRDYLFQGLRQEGKHARKSDYILVSDVDEIIRPIFLKSLKMCTGFDNTHVRFSMQLSYYSYTWVYPHERWNNVIAFPFDPSQVNATSAHEMRFNSKAATLTIQDAGWHCSYCFRYLRQFREKLNSFSHTEFNSRNKPKIHTREHLVNSIRLGQDLLRRNIYKIQFSESIDAPKYVIANSVRFSYLLERRGPSAELADFFE